GYVSRHALLHAQHVTRLYVVILRPEMKARIRIDELHGDAHLVARAAQRSFEDMTDIEFAANGSNVSLSITVRERRRSRDHAQRRHLCQPVGRLFGESVAKHLLRVS